MGFAFLGQSTAVLVINNYGPLQYQALGYDTEDQLRLQCGWITTSVFTNAIGALIMDRVGRKPYAQLHSSSSLRRLLTLVRSYQVDAVWCLRLRCLL